MTKKSFTNCRPFRISQETDSWAFKISTTSDDWHTGSLWATALQQADCSLCYCLADSTGAGLHMPPDLRTVFTTKTSGVLILVTCFFALFSTIPLKMCNNFCPLVNLVLHVHPHFFTLYFPCHCSYFSSEVTCPSCPAFFFVLLTLC